MAIPNPYAHQPLCDLNLVLEILPWFPAVWVPNSAISTLLVASVFASYHQFSSPHFSVCTKAKHVIFSPLLYTVSLSRFTRSPTWL